MTDMARIGRIGVFSVPLEVLPRTASVEFCHELEELGYGAVWTGEGLGTREMFTNAAVILGGTSTIAFCAGIANIWARDPVAMSNGARALQEAYADRFLCGIGVSHKPTIDARLGGGYEKPLTRMRGYVDAMDKAPYVGPNRKDPPPPRVIAALGPQMLRLAAERSLGAHPYFVPVEHTTVARAALGPDPLLAVEQACTLETDAAKAREIARRHMKRYLGLDNYTNNLRRLAWGDADIGNDGSDRLVDAIVAWGGTDAVKARADAHRKNGADHVCLQVLGDDVPGQLRLIAKALL